MSDFSSSMSRRTVAKGVAWSVPAVSIAAAAPSLAASNEPDPPEATTTQITVDQGRTAGQWGLVKVTGRAGDSRPVDGAIPAGTTFTLTPSDGATIEIDPADQTGIASISGPDAAGIYTVVPTDGVVVASLYATIDVPGSITVHVLGSAPGGPSAGTWV
ncbi:hypothetical protein [Janibacter cremeus]|uniref:Uncharacterized protein n=1 Tax=Janibacter cremeus TaxID=1285192 RepID=A0A852VRS6_9MICO|nr:hypothetical protein [Janibacter cremeus]NYF97403.1 hypothetical protein [Janibacter cremeus]